jgi:hypothetical protein
MPTLRTYLQIVQAVEERAAMQAAVETPDKPQMPVADEARLNAFMAFMNKARLRDE